MNHECFSPRKDLTVLIPLRAGSKGLPNKNIKLLDGLPLYLHSVNLALKFGANRIVITTDIRSVLEAGHSDPVEVLHRPSELCTDDTPMFPVLDHALNTLDIKGRVMLLQATSPLRILQDLESCLHMFDKGKYKLVMTVSEIDRTFLKGGFVNNGSFSSVSQLEYCFENRQNLPPIYRANGAVYVFDAERFISVKTFVDPPIGCVVMPPQRSLDIDSAECLSECETFMKASKNADSTP